MTTHGILPTRDDILALALGPADIDRTHDPADIVLSTHAVQRYRERVEGVSRRLAARRLRRLLASARWRSRPLPWTDVVLHPGAVYGYSPDRPDVCLLLNGRVLVTVLSRRFLRRSAAVSRAVAR
ncbi:hypothetical protein [Pseudonocardia lacus]|uniref:hypothetical protein n=1 Tax=Pseudonocardia lacus TaxID=2835865 RepID=UPI001BDCE6E0|nr:hypothetical protein [Pseudonocardia lacus]